MAIQIVRHFNLHIAFSTSSRVECRINPTEIDFAPIFTILQSVWFGQSWFCGSPLPIRILQPCCGIYKARKGLRRMVIIIFTRGGSVLGHYDVEMLLKKNVDNVDFFRALAMA